MEAPKNRVRILANATPEKILALVKSKSLGPLLAEAAAEEDEDDEEEEGEDEERVHFNGYLDDDRVSQLQAILQRRSYSQEAVDAPSPERIVKLFDLHFPAKTREKLEEIFQPSLMAKLDKTPPPIPVEIVPDSFVRLPPIGRVRHEHAASFTTMRDRIMAANKIPIIAEHVHLEKTVRNPFYYPENVPAFMIKSENDRMKKRLADLQIPTLEKLNGVSLIQQIVAGRVKPYQTEHAIVDTATIYNKIVWEAKHGLNITRLQKVARKMHANYINYRKLIFYQEYGIHARNEALKQMRDVEVDEEMALKNYEHLSSFTQESLDNFLRENEESANLAGKIAEEKMKTNIQLSLEVRNLKLETSSMKNEITSLNESLRECKYYMKFLDGVARELMRRDEEEQYRTERRQQQIKEDVADFMKEGMSLRQAQKAIKEKNKEYVSQFKKTKAIMETESGEFIKRLAEEAKAQAERSPIASRINSILQIIANTAHEGDAFNEEELFKELDLVGGSELDDREELSGLVFTKPSQLLNIYVELEEQNLSLIQHAQINEEALETVEKKIQESRRSTENRSRQLRDMINEIEEQIHETSSRIVTLKLLIDMFTGGYYDVKSQEKMMRLLRHHVNKVYKTSIGVNDAHLDSVLMLTSIEKTFEDLVRDLESMPTEIVLKISRDLEKERRETERLEVERERKRHSERRVAKNLERSKAPVKTKKGRNLTFRSRPPKLAISLTQKELDKKAEEEEWNYYFGE